MFIPRERILLIMEFTAPVGIVIGDPRETGHLDFKQGALCLLVETAQ